ncbi:Large neutral amino acids transporter small subunit 3 [Microtus ochrogaster]|uniref:Large neutral amino acids transporter small subunit 3 n=1 Tax=Microtus ochrogaster TaxID=79684 RepID=A0A8J6GM44_MICOH|nr:Large neutral amino acids transporter small subunit 3 [Microtus ochrogaster]
MVIMFTWSGLACLIFLNCALNWPAEAFPAPEEVDYTKKIKLIGLALDHKVTGDRFYTHVTIVGQRLSQKAPSLEEGADAFISSQDISGTSEKHHESECLIWEPKLNETREIQIRGTLLDPLDEDRTC